MPSTSSILLVINYNLHVDECETSCIRNLNLLLQDHNLTQLIKEPTHDRHHILDLLIVTNESQSVLNLHVSDICLSDHYIITFELPYDKPRNENVIVKARNLNNFDFDSFESCLSSALLSKKPDNVNDFNACISNVLDNYAPVCTKTIPQRPFSPWYNSAVKAAKTLKRKAERLWKKTKLTVHKDIYKQKKKDLCNVICAEKKSYINDKITKSSSNKDLFQICNDLMGKPKDKVLPNCISKNDLPNKFNDFL